MHATSLLTLTKSTLNSATVSLDKSLAPAQLRGADLQTEMLEEVEEPRGMMKMPVCCQGEGLWAIVSVQRMTALGMGRVRRVIVRSKALPCVDVMLLGLCPTVASRETMTIGSDKFLGNSKKR